MFILLVALHSISVLVVNVPHEDETLTPLGRARKLTLNSK